MSNNHIFSSLNCKLTVAIPSCSSNKRFGLTTTKFNSLFFLLEAIIGPKHPFLGIVHANNVNIEKILVLVWPKIFKGPSHPNTKKKKPKPKKKLPK